jgi:hypothetical protein
MSDDNEYITLTELSRLFVNASSHDVGKALKAVGMRMPDGQPTTRAIELEVTRRFEGPQSWIPVWKWHKDRILFYLEYDGLKRIDSDEK